MPKEMYDPVRVVDTSLLSEDEWLEYRKHGIGASDLPVVMEVSAYKSVLGLWLEKTSRIPISDIQAMSEKRLAEEQANTPAPPSIFSHNGMEPIIQPDDDFNLTLEVGKALEPVIGRYISKRFGMPVYKDTWMYRHPRYEWMLADLDFIMLTPDENAELKRLVIIECKTASWWKKDDWADGVPWGYELQVRQAMCVMNVDEAVIICLYDNNEGGSAVCHITRDYGLEALIILKGKAFWKDVRAELLPHPTIPTAAARREIAEYARKQEKWKPAPQLCAEGLSECISLYEELLGEVESRKAEYEESREQLDAVSMRLSGYMLHHDKAVCGDFRFRWTSRTTRSVDYDGLKIAAPELYARFVEETTSLGFEVKQKKRTTVEKEAA